LAFTSKVQYMKTVLQIYKIINATCLQPMKQIKKIHTT